MVPKREPEKRGRREWRKPSLKREGGENGGRDYKSRTGKGGGRELGWDAR